MEKGSGEKNKQKRNQKKKSSTTLGVLGGGPAKRKPRGLRRAVSIHQKTKKRGDQRKGTI